MKLQMTGSHTAGTLAICPLSRKGQTFESSAKLKERDRGPAG